MAVDDDDEEVIIEDFPLHKYLTSDDFVKNNASFNIEMDLVKAEPNLVKKTYTHQLTDLQKKITVADHRASLAYIVLSSGFMFPEQVSELDNIIDLDNIQEKSLLSLKETLLFSTVFCAGICSIFFSKQNFTILKVIISVLVGLSIPKLLKVKNKCSNLNTMKSFIRKLERLCQLSRQTLTYIAESELLLKSRLSKQNIILSEVDVMKLESIHYRLFVPEVRKQYYITLKDMCVNFSKTLNFITKSVTLIPAANVSLFPDISTDDLESVLPIPSLEELKKAFNIFLLLQSDCLKRLFLSFVTELWDKDNDSALEGVMKCLVGMTRTIQCNIQNLELMLRESDRVNQRSQIINPINVSTKLKRRDESFMTFSRKFLIKSDVHVSSALNDIRILEEKLSNYDLKESSDEKLLQFKSDILEKMVAVKDDLELFMTLYNDNLNFLLTSTKPAREEVEIVKDIDSDPNEISKKPSIPVGQSSFIPSNEDEIFISLCGTAISESSYEIDHDDFELVPEPLPKSVLSELKCAIEEKRKEWIERESRVLGASQMDFELDGLLPQKHQTLESKVCKSKNRTESGNDPLLCGDKFNVYNTSIKCGSGIDNLENSCEGEVRPTISSFHLPHSFINNIRLAQEKFSLNTQEEVFDD